MGLWGEGSRLLHRYYSAYMAASYPSGIPWVDTTLVTKMGTSLAVPAYTYTVLKVDSAGIKKPCL